MAHSHVGIGDIVKLRDAPNGDQHTGTVTDSSSSSSSVVFRVRWKTGRSWVYEAHELTVVTEVSPVHQFSQD